METKLIALERLKKDELLKNTLKWVCQWGIYYKIYKKLKSRKIPHFFKVSSIKTVAGR